MNTKIFDGEVHIEMEMNSYYYWLYSHFKMLAYVSTRNPKQVWVRLSDLPDPIPPRCEGRVGTTDNNISGQCWKVSQTNEEYHLCETHKKNYDDTGSLIIMNPPRDMISDSDDPIPFN